MSLVKPQVSKVIILLITMFSLGYVADLKANVVRILEGIDTGVLERAAAPQSLSSDFERPYKQDAINAFKSRFKYTSTT